MLCRYYQAYLSAFRMWWLTSRFMTYQSPMHLLQFYERQEQQNLTPSAIKIGDTVHLLNHANQSPFKITLVSDHRSDPAVGYITADSYLGSMLIGLTEQDTITLMICGQRHSFVITQVIRQSYQPQPTSIVCGCLPCQ